MTGDPPDIPAHEVWRSRIIPDPTQAWFSRATAADLCSYRWVDLGTGAGVGGGTVIARVQAQTCPHNLLQLSKTQ